MYDKVFQDHIVDERLDGTILLYIGTWMLLSFYSIHYVLYIMFYSILKLKTVLGWADLYFYRQTFGARSHFSCRHSLTPEVVCVCAPPTN